MPLGETVKGSGECNQGSVVLVGDAPVNCIAGGIAEQDCGQGNSTLTYWCDCAQGLYPGAK